MKNDSFKNERREYQGQHLSKDKLDANPYLQLKAWLQEAIDAGNRDATAMVLGTVDENNHPDTRIVLLKKCDSKSIYFFTDIGSAKGRQIEDNPYVSLNFYWSTLDRQVRIKGKAARLPEKEAKEYFYSRPKTSQLAALASSQSAVIESREALELQYHILSEKYKNTEVPMPANWGGYKVEGQAFEFWQGRPNRLHDRFVYQQSQTGWIISCLAP